MAALHGHTRSSAPSRFHDLELPEWGQAAAAPVPLEKVKENRRKSIARHPDRGITLLELKELIIHHGMDEERWYCSNYGNCDQEPRALSWADKSAASIAECPKCMQMGEVHAWTMYDVVKEAVKERCVTDQISYVEYLQREVRKGKSEKEFKAKTFVSHWWGEEFKDFVAALDRYATDRCIKRQRLRLWAFLHSTASLLLNFALLVKRMASPSLRWGEAFDDLLNVASSRQPWPRVLALIFYNSLVTFVILLLVLLEALWNRHDANNWTFWICAFANNQYELRHALDARESVEESSFAQALKHPATENVVCIIDPKCMIYKRIWCAFELFYVKCVLQKEKPDLPVILINEKGVISEGGLSAHQMPRIRDAIATVKTENAEASKKVDKARIDYFICKEGRYTYSMLDDTLKDLTNVGLDSVSLRRRAMVIFFGLCPITSFFVSDCIFWLVMALRPQNKHWGTWCRKLALDTPTLWFKTGFYFLASIIFLLLIVIMSLSSVEFTVGSPRDGSFEAQDFWRTVSVWRLKAIKEMKIRVTFPAFHTRLQRRVLFKAMYGISMLSGPALTLAFVAMVLLAIQKIRVQDEESEITDFLEFCLAFAWLVRKLWNYVQIVYGMLGLLIGLVYLKIRDKKIGHIRRLLEEILL